MLKTKFGTAKLYEKGHYRITSRKEGNNGKLLHRLIWEENYGEIPDGYVVHHIDRDKTNNCVLNLKLMTKEEHRSLHTKGQNNPMYGKKRSLSTKLRIGKTMNKTGILHVFKAKNKAIKKGGAGYILIMKTANKNQ